MRVVLGVPCMNVLEDYMVRYGVSVLGTFYERRSLECLLKCKEKGLWGMLDSGAFSWWNRNVKSTTGVNEVLRGWYKRKDFELYKKRYIDWLKKEKESVDVYVTLDVIFDPEATWEIWKEMREEGLDPMTVIHQGTDYRWVEKYMQEGIEYLGVSLFVPLTEEVIRWTDEIFLRFVKVDGEEPFPKVHMFGVAFPELFKRYPIYSADSVSWRKCCGYGFVPVPFLKGGRFVFESLYFVKVTKKRKLSSEKRTFFDYAGMVGEEVIKGMAKEVFGEDMSFSELEERLQDSVERSKWSVWYYKKMEEYWSSWRDWEVYKLKVRKYLV
jgi:hypothetical protein